MVRSLWTDIDREAAAERSLHPPRDRQVTEILLIAAGVRVIALQKKRDLLTLYPLDLMVFSGVIGTVSWHFLSRLRWLVPVLLGACLGTLGLPRYAREIAALAYTLVPVAFIHGWFNEKRAAQRSPSPSEAKRSAALASPGAAKNRRNSTSGLLAAPGASRRLRNGRCHASSQQRFVLPRGGRKRLGCDTCQWCVADPFGRLRQQASAVRPHGSGCVLQRWGCISAQGVRERGPAAALA